MDLKVPYEVPLFFSLNLNKLGLEMALDVN